MRKYNIYYYEKPKNIESHLMLLHAQGKKTKLKNVYIKQMIQSQINEFKFLEESWTQKESNTSK